MSFDDNLKFFLDDVNKFSVEDFLPIFCEVCNIELKNPEDGRIIQGNIHMAQMINNQPCAGIVGENFPRLDIINERGWVNRNYKPTFTIEEVKYNIYCKECLKRILQL